MRAFAYVTKHSVVDAGDLRKYYAAIPNLVFKLGLNPYELALYAHFKQAAGDDGGVCWKSRATIAKEAGMSSGMVTKARQALEAPRVELGGKPLVVVKDEASKSGGKPTCLVTITDIWTLNMSKFATSPHDVAAIAPSPHDEQRHTVTSATSPHSHKEELLKKNPEEPSAHAGLMNFLSLKIGPIPNGPKEGMSVKWLLENGYDPAQCRECYDYLAAQPWRTATVTWTTVRANIGAWLARTSGNGKRPTERITTQSDIDREIRDFSTYRHPERKTI